VEDMLWFGFAAEDQSLLLTSPPWIPQVLAAAIGAGLLEGT
jgi:hypothetical protein